jgi:ribosomal protein L7/L12
MEWWYIGLGALVLLSVLSLGQMITIRRDLSRLNRKLAAILQHLNVPFDEFPALSDRVKDLALDPRRKIEAIKAYREETGAGLADAKDAVEAFIASAGR